VADRERERERAGGKEPSTTEMSQPSRHHVLAFLICPYKKHQKQKKWYCDE